MLAGCNATSTPATPTDNKTSATYEMLPGAQSGLQVIPLAVTTASGTVARFQVEVAASREEQSIGMMFRRNVPLDRGMLFPFEPANFQAFWMKNTLVPLDIIFIGEDRRIINIATGVPETLDPVPSEGPVIAILEIAGGRAAELGIAPGDRVDW